MLLRLLLTATVALGASCAAAQSTAEPFQAGTHYFIVDPPQPVPSDGKIEVIEAFSFACKACAAFEPYVQKWARTMPADVRLDFLPGQYNSTWEVFARAYYAGVALGIDKQAHQAVFDAMHIQRSVRSLEDVAKVYAKFGRSEAEFLAAANSFTVNAKLKRAHMLFPRYQIDGTPNLVVAGKYRISGKSAGGQERMFAVVDFLIAKERAARSAAAPVAVPGNG